MNVIKTFKKLSLATLGLFLGSAALARPLGIDVSHWQGTVNWTSVKNSGVTFAWCKATQGTTYTDTQFTTNVTNAKAAGVYIGAYHFAEPATNTGVAGASAEATHFWNVVKNYIKPGGYMMPVLDIESGLSGYTKANASAWINRWCSDIVSKAAATGVTVKPLVYTSGNYASTYMDSSVTQWPLWMASPNGQSSQTGAPSSITPWSTWTFWQYSWTGSVPGVTGDCDQNVFNGTSVNAHVIGAASGPTKFPVTTAMLTDSTHYVDNPPQYAVDGAISTTQYWAAQGAGQWLQANLGEVNTVTHVKIAWLNGSARRETFSVQLSTDGTNWTTMLDHVLSSGTTTALETFDFTDTKARYVRIVGYGNTVNDWNSIAEMEVWTMPATKFPATAAMLTDSTHYVDNPPQYAVDGAISTTQYWAAQGAGQWLQFDLGAAKTVAHVKIAWLAGNARRETFSILLSTDGVNWTTMLDHVLSSGTTLALETFNFANTTARYVRVVGYGNTVNSWNSIAEMEVWTMP
ncbi:MAG: discoidin domain-containing protein [Opitutae bacterium]|nr:discoidin domain-containing protein [Opitutae bacterium]